MPATPRLRSLAALPLLLVATLVVSTFLIAAPASASSRGQRINSGVDIAANQIGDPYKYGAAGPNAFDCSGLVYFSFRRAGFKHVPRTSSAQAGHMRRIRRDHMRRGDFVFFHNGAAKAGNVYHVGVFAGWRNGRRTIIHAPSTGKRVSRAPIWTDSWFPGTLRGL